MNKMRYLLFFAVIFVVAVSCSRKPERPEIPQNAAQNFPVQTAQGKSIYIILEKMAAESLPDNQISGFLMKRLSGSGMEAKINIQRNFIYITVHHSKIPASVKELISQGEARVKKYFQELLEQKISITLQQVDSGFMNTLPPGFVRSGGDYFGKVIPAHFKNQIRLESQSEAVPVLSREETNYLVVRKNILLNGEHILSAKLDREQGRPLIAIKFSSEGAKRFSYYTRILLQERIAVLVNGLVLAAPVVSEHIPDGETLLTGKMTVEKALQMAAFFNASGGVGVKLVSIEYR